MDIKLPSGKYVLAVSGGVDSMVLLDLLSNLPAVELVVAHFNHGIRDDSDQDETLVAEAAGRYGRPLAVGRGGLGPKTSEATARRARYAFLETVRQKHKAKKIITAHHQDDLIETALLSILRGTNRRGLSAIADNPDVLRPLLNIPKSAIISYAWRQQLQWREDSTNQNPDYLRNYIRLKILTKLTKPQRQKLADELTKISRLNRQIEKEVAALSPAVRQGGTVDRQLYSLLPDRIADELMAYWLREDQLGEIDRYEVSRLKLAIKTAKPHTDHPVKGTSRLAIKAKTATFQ